MDFPLGNHPFAFKAAEAAACAQAGGKYWEMHDLLFANYTKLQPENLPGYAQQVGLDQGQFASCLEQGQKERVNGDLLTARRVGVSATPTFLLGWVDDTGKVKVTKQLRGAQPITAFKAMIEDMLEKGPDGDAKADAAGG